MEWNSDAETHKEYRCIFICSGGLYGDIFYHKRPHWLSLVPSNFARQSERRILQAWSELNGLIWARLVFGTSGLIVFSGHHRLIARCCHMQTSCQFSEWQRTCSLCYRAGDWFLPPSCLPFPLCFKAQFREAYDVLTGEPRITPLKDASVQNILQKTNRFCPSIWVGGLLLFRARPRCDVSQRWGERLAAEHLTAAALTRSTK